LCPVKCNTCPTPPTITTTTTTAATTTDASTINSGKDDSTDFASQFAKSSNMSKTQAVMVVSIVGLVLAVVIALLVVLSLKMRRKRQQNYPTDGRAADVDAHHVIGVGSSGVVVKTNPLHDVHVDDNGSVLWGKHARGSNNAHAWRPRETDASELVWDRYDAQLPHVQNTTVINGAHSGLEDHRSTDASEIENQAIRPEDWLDENGCDAIWDRSDTRGDVDNKHADNHGADGARRALSPTSVWMEQQQHRLFTDSAEEMNCDVSQPETTAQIAVGSAAVVWRASPFESAAERVEATDEYTNMVRKGGMRRAATSPAASGGGAHRAERDVDQASDALRRIATATGTAEVGSSGRVKDVSQLMVRGESIEFNRSVFRMSRLGEEEGASVSGGRLEAQHVRETAALSDGRHRSRLSEGDAGWSDRRTSLGDAQEPRALLAGRIVSDGGVSDTGSDIRTVYDLASPGPPIVLADQHHDGDDGDYHDDDLNGLPIAEVAGCNNNDVNEDSIDVLSAEHIGDVGDMSVDDGGSDDDKTAVDHAHSDTYSSELLDKQAVNSNSDGGDDKSVHRRVESGCQPDGSVHDELLVPPSVGDDMNRHDEAHSSSSNDGGAEGKNDPFESASGSSEEPSEYVTLAGYSKSDDASGAGDTIYCANTHDAKSAADASEDLTGRGEGDLAAAMSVVRSETSTCVDTTSEHNYEEEYLSLRPLRVDCDQADRDDRTISHHDLQGGTATSGGSASDVNLSARKGNDRSCASRQDDAVVVSSSLTSAPKRQTSKQMSQTHQQKQTITPNPAMIFIAVELGIDVWTVVEAFQANRPEPGQPASARHRTAVATALGT
jgi:hypothetical protein